MAAPASNRFWAPLREGDRRSLLLWLAVALLMALQVYPGGPGFYVVHFAAEVPPSPQLDWARYTWHHGATFLLFAAIPALLVRAAFREPLADYGVAVGDWRFGLRMTALALVAMPLPLWVSSRDPEFLMEYPLTLRAMDSPALFAQWGLIYLVYYIGWEFFFRGFMGFGLAKSLGRFHALLAQTACSTIIHIGKPTGETFSAIPGGIYMGLLAYRTRSLLWPLLFHWYIGLLNTAFCGLQR